MSVEAMLAVHRLDVKTSATAYRVLMVLAEHADKAGGNAWPAIDTIAAEAQTDRKSVWRLLGTLKELKLIDGTRQRGRSQVTVWSLTFPVGTIKKEGVSRPARAPKMGGMRPPITAIKGGMTPSFTPVKGGMTPSFTTVKGGMTPSFTTVKGGMTPSFTTEAAIEGVMPPLIENVVSFQSVVDDTTSHCETIKGGMRPPKPKKEERKKVESFGLLAIDEVEVDLLGAVSAPEPKPSRSKKPQMTTAEIDAAFSEFWSAYPRKDGRFMARAEYGKAIKSGVAPTELLVAVRAYPFRNDCYDKHAKNWLNGRVWQDEPSPHQGVASGSKAVHKPSKSDWARPGRPNDDFIETTYVEIP